MQATAQVLEQAVRKIVCEVCLRAFKRETEACVGGMWSEPVLECKRWFCSRGGLGTDQDHDILETKLNLCSSNSSDSIGQDRCMCVCCGTFGGVCKARGLLTLRVAMRKSK